MGDQAENDAIEFARRAVHFDSKGDIEAAIYYYKAAADALDAAKSAGSQLANIGEKMNEYSHRGAELLRIRLNSVSQKVETRHASELDLARAEFLMFQALDEDESGNNKDAVELYSEAVELCIQARNNTNSPELQKKLGKLASQALDRAEFLKKVLPSTATSEVVPSAPPRSPKPSHKTRLIPPLGIGGLNLRESSQTSQTSQSSKLLHVSGSDAYTKEELEVLRITSVINGREFVPFMSMDLKERFAYPVLFGDRDGKLVLSPKQRLHFKQWVRPEEVVPSPKLIEIIDCFSIRQTIVSDCSFVASLAVSALYEKRFNKKIITSIIYPQNRNGEPVYNPCGKYMVKLHLNGVPRKVIIDDYLPMGSSHELLCSYSSNKSEFWISLLEKSYLKVMGGYDFPGSNSNIDLHALTSWIPERIAIRTGEADFNKEQTFQMLYDRHRQGHVLATVATGEMEDAVADRAGLVPTHAYALLDIREVLGLRLFLLKNPWSHLRWKGKYSEHDTVNWTRALRDALKYDPNNAQMFDNGVFWIDYDSLCHFFDVIYLNWNPSLFKYTYCIHQSWTAGSGPAKDLYNIGDNPQYTLDVKIGGSTVWILLTRHITDKDDFANNKEYIAILVYKNDGRRVFFPYDPAPYIDGLRINSPHYLCKLTIPSGGATRYTLVVSQYEKMQTIYYTLRAYSPSPFTLSKISNQYKFKQTIKNGEWTSKNAGGCANNPTTYASNPVFQVALQSSTDDNQLQIDLKGPKQFSVGFDVVTVTVNNSSSSGYSQKKSSGTFRSGFTVMEMQNVPSGVYNVIPCTFLPGQCGPFFLTVQATCKVQISRLK